MNYQLYSDVILLCDLPEEGLYAGDMGTVVEQPHVEGLETEVIALSSSLCWET